MTSVVLAQPSDRDRVVAMVVRAFSRDPAWGHICGADYERVAPLFAGALFDTRVSNGTVWVAEDGAAASMWDRPGARSDPDRHWRSFRERAPAAVRERLGHYEAALRPLYPEEPFWYLGVLACDPARREEGLATAVMGPGLRQADRAGLTACLETSTEENKSFYAHRGFGEPVAVELPDGPSTWWLTRRPA
jgi:hypothetical protein